jgi:predicted TIM-barrel fold metal-dependent hydrolase
VTQARSTPRKTIRKPALVTPKGACDCHFHVFEDSQRYPFAPDRTYTPPPASVESYLKLIEALRIERMVVIQASVYGRDNSCTLDSLQALGSARARAVIEAPQNVPMSQLRIWNEMGVRGVRLSAIGSGGVSIDQLRATARKIAPMGWHIDLFAPSTSWPELEGVLRDLPVDVVIEHMGLISADCRESDVGLMSLLRLLESGSVWMKLCGARVSVKGVPYDDVAWLARKYIACAPERCVWGTDWPHPQMPLGYIPNDRDLLDLMLDWAPKSSIRDLILSNNPAALYRF